MHKVFSFLLLDDLVTGDQKFLAGSGGSKIVTHLLLLVLAGLGCSNCPHNSIAKFIILLYV